KAAALLEACASGPDAKAVSLARTALERHGIEFAFTARTNDNRTIALRGLPIADHAVTFLRQRNALASSAPFQTSPEPDYCATLDALPIPVWIRGQDLELRWVNRAFLAAGGFTTKEQAIELGVALERSERELAASARDSGQMVKAKRYAH